MVGLDSGIVAGAGATRPEVRETLRILGCCRALLELLTFGGFEDDVSAGSPSITLFAPTDRAFAEIDGGARGLCAPAREDMLIDMLEYHLVRGRLELEHALFAGSVRTVHGAEVHFTEQRGVVHADGVRVANRGIRCANGVVYLLDGVLAPRGSAGASWLAARKRDVAEPRLRTARM